jgi:hypothetical protein
MAYREPWLEELGLRWSELVVLVAVITHWRLYQLPMLRSEVVEFVLYEENLGEQSKHALTTMVFRRYLKITGRRPGSVEQYLAPTERAMKLLGLDKENEQWCV